MNSIDGAEVHFLSKRGIQISNLIQEQFKKEHEALWENYQAELKRIEEMPKELLKIEVGLDCKFHKK